MQDAFAARPRALASRLWAAAGFGAACLGVLALAAGGWAIGAPLALGGPMRQDWSPLIGAARLAAGLSMLVLARRRWAWAAGAAALLAALGPHFYAYPPFQDGAYVELHHHRSGPDWPAGPARVMLGFAVLAVAVDRAVWPSRRTKLSQIAAFAGLGASVAAYPWFVERVELGSWPGVALPAACATIIAAAAARSSIRQSAIARPMLAQAGVLLLLCAATWLVYQLPVAPDQPDSR